jgi:hypothetical protein
VCECECQRTFAAKGTGAWRGPARVRAKGTTSDCRVRAKGTADWRRPAPEDIVRAKGTAEDREDRVCDKGTKERRRPASERERLSPSSGSTSHDAADTTTTSPPFPTPFLFFRGAPQGPAPELCNFVFDTFFDTFFAVAPAPPTRSYLQARSTKTHKKLGDSSTAHPHPLTQETNIPTSALPLQRSRTTSS